MSERYLAGYDDGRADAGLAQVLAAYAAALDHIRADHDTLRQLHQLHRPTPWPSLRRCTNCGQRWPCATARILTGEPIPPHDSRSANPETRGRQR